MMECVHRSLNPTPEAKPCTLLPRSPEPSVMVPGMLRASGCGAQGHGLVQAFALKQSARIVTAGSSPDASRGNLCFKVLSRARGISGSGSRFVGCW